MKHTQHGLRPTEYYDKNDYPIPVIKSEETLNELDTYCGVALGQVTEYTIDTSSGGSKTAFGWSGNNNAGHIASRAGGMYLEFSDSRECSLAGVKASITMLMNRRPENDMTVDELVAEYGWIE